MRRPSLSFSLLVGLGWLLGGGRHGGLVSVAEAAGSPPRGASAPAVAKASPPAKAAAPAAASKAPLAAAKGSPAPKATTLPVMAAKGVGNGAKASPAVKGAAKTLPAAPIAKNAPAAPVVKSLPTLAPVAKTSPIAATKPAGVHHSTAARTLPAHAGAQPIAGHGAAMHPGAAGATHAASRPAPRPVQVASLPRLELPRASAPELEVPGIAGTTDPDNSRLSLPEPAVTATAATGYMALSGEACEAELTRRGVPFSSAAGEAPGVDQPVRIGGAMRGVETHEAGPASLWHRSAHEILDCRLALAIDDFSAILARHEIAEVLQVSMYRQNARIAGRGTPSQHAAGRALDVAVLVKTDGTRLDIRQDWHSVIGDRSCGAQATPPREASSAALELRAIACEAAAAGIFHLVLTPSFNRDHHDHLHLDIEPRRVGTEVR